MSCLVEVSAFIVIIVSAKVMTAAGCVTGCLLVCEQNSLKRYERIKKKTELQALSFVPMK